MGPAGVFISYRREDASGQAGRLYDRLVAKYGLDRVFRDIDAIKPGTRFDQKIDEAVGNCNALVAVIGRDWLSARDRSGARRLDNPRDWVRLEIAAALEKEVLVIPVLVEDAMMPSEEDLPDPLKPLSYIEALELTERHWNSDVGLLEDVLEEQADLGTATTASDAEVSVSADTETVSVDAEAPARDLEAHLATIGTHLAAEGFALLEDVDFEGTNVRLVATKAKFKWEGEESDVAFVIEEHPSLDWDSLRTFVARAARFAFQSFGKKWNVSCIPVAVTDQVDEALRDQVRTREPPVHIQWGEFAAVYEVRGAVLHCYEGEFWWAKGNADKARKLVRRFLAPE
jgi:TIR domain